MGATVRIRAGLVTVLMLLSAAPAAAAMDSRESYEWSDAGSYQCSDGSWIDWRAGGTGVVSIRQGNGEDASVFFARDNFEWHAVDTRRSDGTTLYTTGHGNTFDAQATHVSGSIYEVTTVATGQPRVIRDAEGNVLARDRGSVRTTFLFDTLGDDDPGGELVEELSVRVNGPQSGEEICDLLG